MTAAHRFRRMLAAPFSRRPFLLQRLRWPNPLRPPYLQREITLYRPGELGDVVMCLAVVGAIRARNPAAKITFVTNYHALLRGHPLLDRVLSEEEARAANLRDVIALRYEVFVPLRLHMIDYLAGCVGLTGIDRSIPLPDFTSELGDLLTHLPHPRPWIMICRNAGPFSPNKDWPAERWDALVERLTREATVIDLGTAASQPSRFSDRYVDLRGRTTQRQYCALLALANLVITPASSAIHIAAAYGIPTLSILSGYELPVNSAYPRHTALHRKLPCSPCWLTTPCPIDRKCLREIAVEEVATTATRLLREAPRRRE